MDAAEVLRALQSRGTRPRRARERIDDEVEAAIGDLPGDGVGRGDFSLGIVNRDAGHLAVAVAVRAQPVEQAAESVEAETPAEEPAAEETPAEESAAAEAPAEEAVPEPVAEALILINSPIFREGLPLQVQGDAAAAKFIGNL